MRKYLAFLPLFFAFAFQQVSGQILYTRTTGTGNFYNPGFGQAGTPKIVFDDVNIPNASIPTGTSIMSINKLKLGLVMPAASPTFSVMIYATAVDPNSVGRDSLPAIPPVLLGILHVLPNYDATPKNITLNLGNSVNPIFIFQNDPNNVYPGFTTFYIGLSFPDAKSLAGWELADGPGMNVDTMHLYNKDHLTTSRYYSRFGYNSTPPPPYSAFNIEVSGKPISSTPVVLTNFDVQKVNNQNLLNWSTSQEIISNYYAVEHSTDGNNFEAIGQVAAAGNSSIVRSYNYTDLNPGAGINYYRLKMVDLDNSMKYSEIKSVRNATSHFSFSAYPNPALETLFLKIPSEKSDRALLTVTNVSGQIMFKEEIKLSIGNNNIPVKVNNLSAGAYIIKVQSGSKSLTQKFNKQ
ncbi:MAG: T9SS type A sorting domain-containing protein [Ginsengibacter sp.]